MRTLQRAFRIIETFRNSEVLSLAEVTSRTGLPKTTVYRNLEALESMGYIEMNEEAHYRLGFRILSIGRDHSVNYRLRGVAQPQMQALLDRVGETVNLGVLEGCEVLHVEVFESASTLRVSEKPGSLAPAHCTALGKCLLAHLSDVELERVIRSLKLNRYTERTITSPRVLREELEQIRKLRVAVDNEETARHVSCVAAPIWDETGRVPAALSITGPTQRLLETGLEKILSELLSAAASVSNALGTHRAIAKKVEHTITERVKEHFSKFVKEVSKIG